MELVWSREVFLKRLTGLCLVTAFFKFAFIICDIITPMINSTKVSFFLSGSLVLLVIAGFTYHLKSEREFLPTGESYCYYENFEGVCKVISIDGRSTTAGRVSGSDLEINFEFEPMAENNSFNNINSNSEKEGKVTVSPNLMNKFDIEMGDTYKCTMRKKVIGTCPPVVFEFLWAEKLSEE